MKLEKVNEDTWWEVVKSCNYATFFHTPIWNKLVTQTYPNCRDKTFVATLKDGVRVVLPLLEIRKRHGMFREVVSTFAGCYGDIIADGSISGGDKWIIYEKLGSRNTGRITITENPISNRTCLPDEYVSLEDFTHVLNLDRDFESIFSQFSKGHRSSYKKGLRLKVETRLANKLEDYRSYYLAYEDSLRRWGEKATSFYPWELFENLFLMSQIYPKNIRLWLAEMSNKVVAGALTFYWGTHVVWWHGAAFEEYFSYYPNNVLQTQIIQNSIEEGYQYYDFNPSGGHRGVAAFKKNFGAEKKTFYRWRKESLKYKVARGIIRHIKS
jgi:hypothetical protein